MLDFRGTSNQQSQHRRLKLYQRFELEVVESAKKICYGGSLNDRENDVDLLDLYYDNTSDLNGVEKSSLYIILRLRTPFLQNTSGSGFCHSTIQ